MKQLVIDYVINKIIEQNGYWTGTTTEICSQTNLNIDIKTCNKALRYAKMNLGLNWGRAGPYGRTYFMDQNNINNYFIKRDYLKF